MFLDEELENILKENENDSVKACKNLLNACFHRLPDANKVTAATFENSLRQIENSWKLFCSRHRQFKPDGFKKCVLLILKDFPEDQINKFKAIMKW